MTEKISDQLTELEECVLESANAGKPLWVHDGKTWYVASFVKLEKQRLAIPDGDLGKTRGGLTYDLEKARMKKPTGRGSLEQVRPPFA
jgi:hypothetical protein